MRLGQGLRARLQAALQNDNTIVVSEADVKNVRGFSTDHMETIGLTSSDLKKLENSGFAIRGYNTIRRPGKVITSGTERKTMWILLDTIVSHLGAV